MKNIGLANRSTADIDHARQYAAEMSKKNHSTRYIIQIADYYVVSTTCDLQKYEVLIETYKNGVLVTEPVKSEAEPLAPVLFPTLIDMEKAVTIIKNALVLSDLTPMLTREEENKLLILLTKWETNFNIHKNMVVESMKGELK